MRAQDTADYDETAANDIFASARKSGTLVDWTFLSRLRTCRKNGELGSTLILLLCGCVLGGLLFVANTADRLAGLFRS